MIDLAPSNPYSLPLRSPVLARAGLGGAGVERLAALEGVGAVVSDILTAVSQPRAAWHTTPGGVLWPDGGRSSSAARRDLARWGGFGTPVIVAIAAQSVADLQTILADIEPGPINALWLDLTGVATIRQAHELAAELRRRWHYPILLELPLAGPPPMELAMGLAAHADALVLGRGPAGAVVVGSRLAQGRIVGPAAHAYRLLALSSLLAETSMPLVVSAASLAEARDIRRLAGDRAIGFLLDVALWYDQSLARQIAAGAR